MHMEFRSPSVAAQQNAKAVERFTKDLVDVEKGRAIMAEVLTEMGNAVGRHPSWHPILTAPPRGNRDQPSDIMRIEAYEGMDHTQSFVRGFLTCPYSDKTADALVDRVNGMAGLQARRLDDALYADNAFPVLVSAEDVELEADGTIRGRDALTWFTRQAAASADTAEVGETWWTMRSHLLGWPHGSRSSLFVNQNTGLHMRRIHEAMNAGGMFGPVKEWSLDMLSKKKRDAVSRTLIEAAATRWDGASDKFEFEMHGETCKASVRDTWGDGEELSISVEIGDHDLYVSGFHHPRSNRTTFIDPVGRRDLADKFL